MTCLIDTLLGVKTKCMCRPDQTLFPQKWEKWSGHVRLVHNRDGLAISWRAKEAFLPRNMYVIHDYPGL